MGGGGRNRFDEGAEGKPCAVGGEAEAKEEEEEPRCYDEPLEGEVEACDCESFIGREGAEVGGEEEHESDEKKGEKGCKTHEFFPEMGGGGDLATENEEK